MHDLYFLEYHQEIHDRKWKVLWLVSSQRSGCQECLCFSRHTWVEREGNTLFSISWNCECISFFRSSLPFFLSFFLSFFLPFFLSFFLPFFLSFYHLAEATFMQIIPSTSRLPKGIAIRSHTQNSAIVEITAVGSSTVPAWKNLRTLADVTKAAGVAISCQSLDHLCAAALKSAVKQLQLPGNLS